MKDGKYIDSNSAYVAFRDINEQIASMSNSEFAKKLVNIFNALKSHAETAAKLENINSELNRAKTLLKTNKRISNACLSSGKTNISKRYEILIAKNIERIDALTKEKDSCTAKFNKMIEKLSEKYKELLKLKF